jgi:hypothetical protein
MLDDIANATGGNLPAKNPKHKKVTFESAGDDNGEYTDTSMGSCLE